jgi:hypothetical protein
VFRCQVSAHRFQLIAHMGQGPGSWEARKHRSLEDFFGLQACQLPSITET